jgi:hypothetical protein
MHTARTSSHRTHPPAVDVDSGARQPTTPSLRQPDSQRAPAAPRQRDARSLLPRRPYQRRPRGRHDHVEELEFRSAQPAAAGSIANLRVPSESARRQDAGRAEDLDPDLGGGLSQDGRVVRAPGRR